MVVPIGTLYEQGVPKRIRQQLIEEFNLTTVLRFPKGVFEPYTDIATNILFFDVNGPTKGVWFYERPLPPRRAHLKGRSYSATDGLTTEEFLPYLQWWHNRQENEQAWYVPTERLVATDYDLALSHPKHETISLDTSTQVMDRIHKHWAAVDNDITILANVVERISARESKPLALRHILRQRESRERIRDDKTYMRPRVQLHFRGVKVRDEVLGTEIGSRLQTLVHSGDLIISRIDARNGAMALYTARIGRSHRYE